MTVPVVQPTGDDSSENCSIYYNTRCLSSTLHLLKVCLQVLEILLKLSYVLVFVFAMVNLQAHTVVWRA